VSDPVISRAVVDNVIVNFPLATRDPFCESRWNGITSNVSCSDNWVGLQHATRDVVAVLVEIRGIFKDFSFKRQNLHSILNIHPIHLLKQAAISLSTYW
jgi:hypothetical protein